jgi:hypothetical protein
VLATPVSVPVTCCGHQVAIISASSTNSGGGGGGGGNSSGSNSRNSLLGVAVAASSAVNHTQPLSQQGGGRKGRGRSPQVKQLSSEGQLSLLSRSPRKSRKRKLSPVGIINNFGGGLLQGNCAEMFLLHPSHNIHQLRHPQQGGVGCPPTTTNHNVVNHVQQQYQQQLQLLQQQQGPPPTSFQFLVRGENFHF